LDEGRGRGRGAGASRHVGMRSAWTSREVANVQKRI
jgi:hypothetical protein